MKKLVLLLQNPQADFHLGSILILLNLTVSVFLDVSTYISFAYIVMMPFYSYSSGFVYKKSENRKIFRYTLFIFLLLSSFPFVTGSFFELNLLYYFGKINVTTQELRELKPETWTNIFFLSLSVLAVWIALVTFLRRQGIKSAITQLKNEFEKTPQT